MEALDKEGMANIMGGGWYCDEILVATEAKKASCKCRRCIFSTHC